MENLSGRQLGPYQIVSPLGEGGMAAVYKAYQPSMDRYVALKVLPRHFASDPEFIGRFSQEARVIANLQHPHILPVHDFGQADGYAYLAMRFIDGGTLADWLVDRHPLALEKVRSIMTQVGGALDYAHAQGVIHRDIKPSNILVDRWDNCQLTDFGLAKIMASSSQLTQTGGILGTPAYMSPEQGLGKEIDQRSDIYSLGVVLYQMAIGRLPYQAETPMAVVIKHIHDPLPPPRQQNPNLPESVERVILKALAKDAADRFGTAGELVRALQAAATRPSPAPSPAPPLPISSPEPDAASEQTTIAARRKPSAGQPKSRPKFLRVGCGLLGVAAVFIVGLAILSGLNNNGAVDTAVPGGGEQTGFQEVQSVDELMAIVDEAHGGGDIGRALDAINRAIELAPEQADLYCQRGYTLRDLEDDQAAIASFERCRILAQEQQLSELQSEASGQGTLTQVALVMTETDDPGRALAVFDEALQKPDAPPWLICERGERNVWYDNEAAVADFEACKARNPADDYWPWRAESIINMIRAYDALEHENYDAAIEHFTAWADLVPDLPWARCGLGDALAGAGEFASALDQYNLCLEFALAQDDSSAEDAARSGQFYAQARLAQFDGDLDRALDYYSQAIELTPEYANLFCERGMVHQELGHLDEAGTDYATCLDLFYDDQDGRSWAEELLQSLEP